MSQTSDGVAGSGQKVKMNVVLHYVRNLHFEYADKSSLFTKVEQKQLAGRPEVKAQVNIIGQHIRNNVYESIMDARVAVSVENVELYTITFSYATVVIIDDVESYSDTQKQYATTVQAAYLAFPFARRVLFDVTRDSGSTPISLDAIDFDKLYNDSKLASAAQSGESKTIANGIADGASV